MNTAHEHKTPTRNPDVLTNNEKLIFCKKNFKNGVALLIDAVVAIIMIFS